MSPASPHVATRPAFTLGLNRPFAQPPARQRRWTRPRLRKVARRFAVAASPLLGGPLLFGLAGVLMMVAPGGLDGLGYFLAAIVAGWYGVMQLCAYPLAFVVQRWVRGHTSPRRGAIEATLCTLAGATLVGGAIVYVTLG